MPEISIFGSLIETFENLQIAVDFLRAENYDQAEKFILISLRAQPAYANAIYLLSVCMEKKGKTEIANQLKNRSFFYLNPCFFRAKKYDYDRILKYFAILFNESLFELKNQLFSRMSCMTHALKKDYSSFELLVKYYFCDEFNTDDRLFQLSPIFNANLLDLAYQYQEKSMERNGRSYGSLNNSAVVCFAQQKYGEAELKIQESLANNPNFPGTKFIEANLYSKTGRHEEALQAINKAIEIRKDWISYRFHAISLLLRFFPEKIITVKEQIEQALNIAYPEDHSCYFAKPKNKNICNSILCFLLTNAEQVNSANANWRTYLEDLSDMAILGEVQSERLYIRLNKMYPILGYEVPEVKEELQVVDMPFPNDEFIEYDSSNSME